jgi:hypothetical protein
MPEQLRCRANSDRNQKGVLRDRIGTGEWVADRVFEVDRVEWRARSIGVIFDREDLDGVGDFRAAGISSTQVGGMQGIRPGQRSMPLWANLPV